MHGDARSRPTRIWLTSNYSTYERHEILVVAVLNKPVVTTSITVLHFILSYKRPAYI
jgi:hypothetical protein